MVCAGVCALSIDFLLQIQIINSGGVNVQTKYPQISAYEMGSCQNSSCCTLISETMVHPQFRLLTESLPSVFNTTEANFNLLCTTGPETFLSFLLISVILKWTIYQFILTDEEDAMTLSARITKRYINSGVLLSISIAISLSINAKYKDERTTTCTYKTYIVQSIKKKSTQEVNWQHVSANMHICYLKLMCNKMKNCKYDTPKQYLINKNNILNYKLLHIDLKYGINTLGF